MTKTDASKIPAVLEANARELGDEWFSEQLKASSLRPDLLSESELRQESTKFLALLCEATRGDNLLDIHGPNWASLRDLLTAISRSRARLGFTPTEIATFVLSFKQPLFSWLRKNHNDLDALTDDLWNATALLDALALYTSEVFLTAREEIIARQQEEMFELSSPVVELWQGILGLPLIGTLDSRRTQLVMETLLTRIAQDQTDVAIIDITGVPTVDTLTAQHLLKTVYAIRLMGAECIISGVRPQIATTMVGLGINLGDVTTKATMAGALTYAFKKLSLVVSRADKKS